MEEKRNEHTRRPRKKQKTWRRVLKGFFLSVFTLFLVGTCTAAMFAGIFLKYVETTVMPNVDVRAEDYTMKISSVVYYQDKESGEWTELQKVYGTENRIWVDFDQMPEHLWQAVVAIEDERFFQHEGVDWWRTGGAVVNMFVGMKNTFGGSTITQQLLKNITEDNDPYVNRKIREICRALEFEKNYTKEQILELYLNTIYLGQGCYGVQTAAEFYFGKDVSELSVAECASLIAITNNPSMYGPMYDIEITVTNSDGKKEVKTPRQLNKERQTNVLNKMGEVGRDGTKEDGFEPFLTEAEVKAAKAEILKFSDGSTSVDDIIAKANSGIPVNNWFVEQVIKDVAKDLAELKDVSIAAAQTMLNNGGYQIYTTMDYDIQKILESVYENRENLDVTSKQGEPLQSGMTVMDPYTGNVVGMVGCVGEKEGNLWTNYAVEKFQVGSSIKPLTCYAPALELGAITPATTFDNWPVRLYTSAENENGTPWPKNSPNTYTGWTTIAEGVRRSINTIAVQTVEALGCPEAFAFATEKLGLGLVAADMDVSPLGMGGLTHGLSTEEMAAAYSTFVNSGIYNSPKLYLEVKDANGETVLTNEGTTHVAMKETTAHFMNEMLKTAVNSGTGTAARISGMTVAGKTGTTNDNRARYFVGYTPYYVGAVWTGYRTNEKISYNGNPAITMWKLAMEQIHAELENKDFVKPSTGLEKVTICRDSGLLCSDACHADVRGDRALQVTVATGTAPTETCAMHVFRDYCTEGQCLATENCLPETIIQAGFLDYMRPEYFKEDGTRITCEDEVAILYYQEKAIGLHPDILEDGTEVYPEVIGCPVHVEYVPPIIVDPEDPFWEMPDPSDPDYDAEFWEGILGFEPDDNTPSEPQEPETDEPAQSLWDTLWNNLA